MESDSKDGLPEARRRSSYSGVPAPHCQGPLQGGHCLVPSSLCAWATGRCQRHKAALGQWKRSAESQHVQGAGCGHKASGEDVRWGSRRGL